MISGFADMFSLPPPVLVNDDDGFRQLVRDLGQYPVVAIDTESNSLHAYREQVCLIQFSTPARDYIVDPLRLADLSPLAPVCADISRQKVFHAAEYDIICLKRDYQFEFANIFDTMSAARTLGWPQVGLAAILDTQFGVKMNKKYQRADWKRRPLSSEQLDYARLDTHYLGALRDRQLQSLTESGRWPEAREEFERLARVRAGTFADADATAFWRVKGARDLSPRQAAVLQALFAYREQQAQVMDRAPFKVMGESTLMELARRGPCRTDDLTSVPGMTPTQIHQHARGLLEAVQRGLHAPTPVAPQLDLESDEVRDRYERLQLWRKERARARGVESDVIVPRGVLWDLARHVPRTPAELEQITDFGPWRRATYGEEILALLSSTTASHPAKRSAR